jgi:CRP-like cAMP-binding protein
MHPVVRKLSIYATFSSEEESALGLAFTQTFEVGPKTPVVFQDDPPQTTLFLLKGFASRRKALSDGRDQILAFMIAGDACDMGVALLEKRDHGISTLSTSAVFARVSQDALRHLADQYPKIRDAFYWATLMEESIGREWIVNVGQRHAAERMAHLFCELYHRLNAVGLANGHNVEFPVIQQDLGAALGMSTVHINRTLQLLRDRGLIAFGDHRLTILDLPGLERLAGFDDTYLHIRARYNAGHAGSVLPRPA